MAMFSDRTYETLLSEMLALAPDGIDTRQGSIYYDAIASCAFKLASFYVDLDCILDLTFVGTASGEYLDRKGYEYGLDRNEATAARYEYLYKGTKPQIGARFFADSLYFTLQTDDDILYLLAETPGEESNTIAEGTPATPVNTIIGLSVSEFGALIEPGAATEDDSSYRRRIQEKIAGPAQNGNKQHYKTWCEEVDGVGRARILPLWAGENTVKAVLLDTDGLPAADTVVARVQAYIDPDGTGIGEGVANVGAHFTAVAAIAVPITVSCTITLAYGFTIEEAQAAAETALLDYLRSLALDTPDKTAMVVRISSIGAILYSLESVIDYSDLQVNGEESNLAIDNESVAVLNEVSFVGSV